MPAGASEMVSQQSGRVSFYKRLEIKELSFNLNVIYQSITFNSPGYFMSVFSLLLDFFPATPY